jgi:hypothetical protein
MSIQTTSFGALIPASGFRWIYRDPSGSWDRREPPEDWPESDYRAVGLEGDDKPELANRFYLAASTDDCLQAHADQNTEFGKVVFEPDLYLKFASARPTPRLILEFANRYGLLRYNKARFSVKRRLARDILPAFHKGIEKLTSQPKLLYLTGENAFDWLKVFTWTRLNLRTWTELQRQGPAKMNSYLDNTYNYVMGGSLTFQVRVDQRTGQANSEIFASSLAAALDVQWGMSIAADVEHRQCSACPNWFAVHPGSARPEKQFCSDACRMRAYRQRKHVKRSGSTNRSSKRKA